MKLSSTSISTILKATLTVQLIDGFWVLVFSPKVPKNWTLFLSTSTHFLLIEYHSFLAEWCWCITVDNLNLSSRSNLNIQGRLTGWISTRMKLKTSATTLTERRSWRSTPWTSPSTSWPPSLPSPSRIRSRRSHWTTTPSPELTLWHSLGRNI